ncbi:unnamed protein product [Caenorhabditis auriculariae]|uniref:Solute carrier family 40 member n=1 Tax=Caenorhabditis auriculariae TaxID=2777116 RepID=A0A8S1HTY0_9PELO|nr:unnamed protein product [Caenorhabditis auriculariae]
MQLIGGMRIVSIEQFAEGTFQMIFSGYLGKIFDRLSRKTAILTVVPINNLSICLAAGLFIVCLSVDEGSVWFPTCLALGMLVCAVNRLFLNAEKFIVGRDWVVVLGTSETLAGLNATLTTLDQFANVISPIITGALVSLTSLRTTCGIFAAAPTGIFGVIKTYYRTTVFSAALGMALLFMSVMGFDGLAVGYGMSAGLPEVVVGAFRSFGSVMGITGAISYAFFERIYGVRRTGIIGFMIQQICLIIAVSSIFLPGTPMDLKGYFSNVTIQSWWSAMVHSFDGTNTTQEAPQVDWKHFTSNGHSLASIFAFLIGIATARCGLWMLDLSITQIMQVNVAEIERNTVFGVHNALCQTFAVMKHPEDRERGSSEKEEEEESEVISVVESF